MATAYQKIKAKADNLPPVDAEDFRYAQSYRLMFPMGVVGLHKLYYALKALNANEDFVVTDEDCIGWYQYASPEMPIYAELVEATEDRVVFSMVALSEWFSAEKAWIPPEWSHIAQRVHLAARAVYRNCPELALEILKPVAIRQRKRP